MESNTDNEGLLNDQFQQNSLNSGDNLSTEHLSEFQVLLQKTESTVSANLENLQNGMKQIEIDETSLSKAISPKKSIFTLASSEKEQVRSSERTKTSRVTCFPASNNKDLYSIVNATPNDPKYKMLVDPQLKNLKEEVTTLIKQCISKEDMIISFEKRLANSEKIRNELQKTCSTLEHENEKLKKRLDETTDKYNAVQLELYAAKSSLEDVKKSNKSVMAAKSDMEKQLAQISAQKDKLNMELQDLKANLEDSQVNHKKIVLSLKSEYKVAIKQKEELIDVLKKQMRLANNLKRQLLHFKAAVSQSYLEKEVLKVAENSF